MTDHIAEARKMVTRPQIRDAFLRNGAAIPADRDDLPDWVYEAAFELLELAVPAVQGEPVAALLIDEPEQTAQGWEVGDWDIEPNPAAIEVFARQAKPDAYQLYLALQPGEWELYEWPKLEKPAKVGGVRFSAGVSSRLVVEAAQRQYEYDVTPEKEAQRIARFDAFRQEVLQPIHKVAGLAEALEVCKSALLNSAVSCQRGVVETCCCRQCAYDMAHSALAAHRKGGEE